jgi:hypothetical protein
VKETNKLSLELLFFSLSRSIKISLFSLSILDFILSQSGEKSKIFPEKNGLYFGKKQGFRNKIQVGG